ncbi:hypothetical protein MKW98_024970 [Papaver atlanticum]|uniref:Uncharacterized protein n=1 Tax=Papaver atlanticum TaxID=357466 RepID=A0AAD4T1L3_9MAGN|nr:hypothetical protein MKW98_024970 [Papaver atlanticum]
MSILRVSSKIYPELLSNKSKNREVERLKLVNKEKRSLLRGDIYIRSPSIRIFIFLDERLRLIQGYI